MVARRPLLSAAADALSPRDDGPPGRGVVAVLRPRRRRLAGLPEPGPWRRALVKGAVAYVASRLIILVAGGLVAAADAYRAIQEGLPKPPGAGQFVLRTLTSWDGLWYLAISREGYPRSVVPNVTYFDGDARAAFFPVFPWSVRLADRVLPGGDTAAALIVNAVFGVLFVYLVGVLARRLYDERVAGRAMVLVCLFPGSFVLSFAYSEAIFLTLAALALLCLVDERWLLAGAASALATATRPNGVALVVACAVAAGVVCWRARRPLLAPLAAVALAPLGFVGFQLYLGRRTGETFVWFRVQREAWEEGASFGWTAVSKTWDFTLHPFVSAANTITALCVLATIGLLVALRRARMPLAVSAYAVAVIVLMLLPATVTARPRFLFTAFPALIAFAAVWPPARRDGERDADWWGLLLALNGAGLVAVTTLYGVWAAIP